MKEYQLKGINYAVLFGKFQEAPDKVSFWQVLEDERGRAERQMIQLAFRVAFLIAKALDWKLEEDESLHDTIKEIVEVIERRFPQPMLVTVSLVCLAEYIAQRLVNWNILPDNFSLPAYKLNKLANQIQSAVNTTLLKNIA